MAKVTTQDSGGSFSCLLSGQGIGVSGGGRENGGWFQGVAVGYCYRGMLEWLPSLQNAVLCVLIPQLLRVLVPNFSSTPFGTGDGGKHTFVPLSHFFPPQSADTEIAPASVA